MTRYSLLLIALIGLALGAAATPLRAQEPAVLLQRYAEEINTHVQQDRAGEAVPTANALIRLLESNPELATLDHAIALNGLAVALHDSGKHDEAIPFYRAAIDLLRRIEDPAVAVNLIVILENYGILLINRSDFSTAGRLLAEALRLRNQIHGGEHPDFEQHVAGLTTLALHLQEYDDFATAEPLLREILQAKRLVLGTKHPQYGVALNNLGQLLYARALYSEAEPLYREALEIIGAAQGTEHIDYITTLGNLAVLLQDTGDLAEAEKLLRESLELRRKVQGTENPGYALALNNLAQILYYNGNFTEAEPLYREALQIFRSSLGTDDQNYATTISNLGQLLAEKGDLAVAEPLLREACEIYRRILGPSHQSYARSLAMLARLHHRKGELDEAAAGYLGALDIFRGNQRTEHPDYIETLSDFGRLRLLQYRLDEAVAAFREALELLNRILGPTHTRYATELRNLAELLATKASYGEAEALYHEALEILRHSVGTEHPNYLETLSGLALTLLYKGDYATAEPILREIVDTRRHIFGTGHPTYAAALNNLATLLLHKAVYTEAEPLFREALEIWRQHPDVDQQNYASALGNLAQLLVAIGNLDDAEPLLLESIEVRRRLHGPEHPGYAGALNNLASFYNARRDHAKAEPLYREVVRIFATTHGTGHPDYGTAAGNLAGILRDQGNYDEAIATLRDALEIRRRTLGNLHPQYALALNNLAVLLADVGDLTEAEPLYLEALQIALRTLGPRHPETTHYLINLASLNQTLGRPDSARALMKRALEAEQELLQQVFSFTSERVMLAYVNSVRFSLSIFLSMVDLRPDDVTADDALHWILLRKGAVLSALASYRQVERIATADPEIANSISRLHDARRQLTSITLNPPAGVAPDSLNQLITQLNQRREALEVGLSRSLSSRIAGDLLGASNEPASISILLDDIRRALPGTGALVEFVRYLKTDFTDKGQSRSITPHYAALILRPTGPVRWVPLGEAEEIELAISNLRTAHMGCESGERSQFCSESNYKAAAEEAYLRIFDPLEPYLEGAEQIFASLDGELNQVPLGALVDLGGLYLIERFRIAYLSSGRDLLRQPARGETGKGTTVFAGPTFDLVPTAKASSGHDEASPKRDGAAVGDVAYTTPLRAPAPPEALRSLKWDELPGALAEADDVRAALEGTPRAPVTIHTAERATEDAFKATRAPRILHLATHGFFIPERDLTPEERAQCLAAGSGLEQQPDLETGMGRGIERLRCAENPLLRSGIVLAGANAVGTTTATEDGWVLAEEIATLDLAGTELVVLSACETGLGDVKTGEGVYGLRRAFELAGAERILMSLFKVPDTATRDLLAGFYRRLAAGESAEEALRESQLELREKHPHPFYWASFVLVGNGR